MQPPINVVSAQLEEPDSVAATLGDSLLNQLRRQIRSDPCVYHVYIHPSVEAALRSESGGEFAPVFRTERLHVALCSTGNVVRSSISGLGRHHGDMRTACGQPRSEA